MDCKSKNLINKNNKKILFFRKNAFSDMFLQQDISYEE